MDDLNSQEPLAEELYGSQPSEESVALEPPIKTIEPKTEEKSFSSFSPEAPLATTMTDTKETATQELPKLSLEKEESEVLPWKKILLIIGGVILVGVLALVLFKKLKPQPITLNYWGLWEPEEVMKEVLDDYHRLHPNITVKYAKQYHVQYRERLTNALAKNEGPDIFRLHNSWLPMFKNDLLPFKVTDSDFYPTAIKTLKSGDKFQAVPLETDTLALFYNEDLLNQSGASVPKTWDELRSAASKITVRDAQGKIQTAGVALGTASNVDHWPDILTLMFLQNTVDLRNLGASKEAADALTYYSYFTLNDKVWDGSMENSTLAFASGNLGFYFGYSWDFFEIKNLNPRLNFKVVSAPQLSSEEEINLTSFWVEGIAKKTKHPKESQEFLNYLASKETLQKLYGAQAKLRGFGEPYPRPSMADLLKSDANVSVFVKQSEKATSGYFYSRTFDNGLNDKNIRYLEDAVNAFTGGKSSSEEALKAAGQGIQQTLQMYGVK